MQRSTSSAVRDTRWMNTKLLSLCNVYTTARPFGSWWTLDLLCYLQSRETRWSAQKSQDNSDQGMQLENAVGHKAFSLSRTPHLHT